MTVIEICELQDGSAKVTLDMSEREEQLLLVAGLEFLIEEAGYDIKVIPLNEYTPSEKNCKTVDLTDEMYDFLIEHAVVNLLREYIEKNDK